MLNTFMIIPFYVYKITLNSSGQFYYGSRTANVRHNRSPERDLWISYYTSSNTIKRLIKEFGKDAFSAEVVYTTTDFDQLYWYEQSLIKEHINNPQCLNKKYQDQLSGHTIFSTTGKPSWNKGRSSPTKGIPRSPEIVAKISANRKGKGLGIVPKNKGVRLSDEKRQAISQRMKGRLVGELNPFYGKTHSDETRAKIAANTSKHQKGRLKPKNPCPHCGFLCAPNTMPHHLRKHLNDASK